MGCGCRKANNTRKARMKALEQANRIKKLASKKAATAKGPASLDKLAQAEKTRRLSICEQCSYSAQTAEEKKAGTKICHKCKRHTFAIASNIQFKCPKEKF